MSSSRREVLLGVGGGIAAYKACDLLRRLQDSGYVVTVVPTPAALNFVGSATWEALSGRPVYTQVWENVPAVTHISYAQNADYVLIAPATADLIARIVHGRADDLLTNIVLASTAPKLIIPAMHPQMWNNSATIENVRILRERGFSVMEPETGRLTGSDSGQGRFPETVAIVEKFEEIVGRSADLSGRTVLVTAGGTREPIDPVRFIGNRSSGIQGYAIARAAAARGAKVQLIAANSHEIAIPGVEITPVETAAQMQDLLLAKFPHSDILVMTAAVADARPKVVSSTKIKKSELEEIQLLPNPDLLASVALLRKSGQIIVGFAAETENLIANASNKLLAKGLDLIYVNNVSDGAIFGSELTHGHFVDKDGVESEVSEVTKDTLAHELLDKAVYRLGLPNV